MKKKNYLSLCNQALLEGYAACYGNQFDLDGNSISPEKGFLVPVTLEEYPAIDKDILQSFVRTHRNLLYKPNNCLLVYEHINGTYSICVCNLIDDKRNAVFLGLVSKQKFIFDNQTKHLSYSKR